MLADKKKEIYDGDIAALIEQQIHGRRRALDASSRYQVTSGTGKMPEVDAARPPRRRAQSTTSMACGDGPIDAIFLAIEKLTGMHGRLQGLPRPQRHGRQGRPGRSDRRSRTRRPASTAAAASRPTASRPAPRRSSTPSTASPP